MAKRNLAPPASPEDQAPPADLNGHVSRRAYDLFLARGGEHGRDLEDWTQAERELAGGSRADSDQTEP
jgi:DUF2934 family protein